MTGDWAIPSKVAAVLLLGASILITGCGGEKPPATTSSAPADVTPPTVPAVTPVDVAAQPAAVAESESTAESNLLTPTETTWTPEAMEELLAPVALYPDVVLGQLLVSSANPQEVLDAGNWLLQNQDLQGKPLDEAAKTIGFTPPIRGLMQSPEVIDMMCSEMGWTSELGQAYVNDQAGVLDAVQRLRVQAKDVGNLANSEQMKVTTEVQEGQQVIIVSPPSPQVVYVPQYDPVAVYAPAPPVATTTTTVVNEGHSTESLVATGLLSFGAGILVANIFDDDDDYYHGGYYHPRYYGPPMPYYPPYPYRPSYGNGYYPNHGYNRPPNYQHGFNNNNVNINVNQNNNYWNNFDNKPGTNRNARSTKSPITAAKPNRSELSALNAQAKAGPKRPAPGQQDSWKGQNSYAGAKQPDKKPTAARSAARGEPKVQGSYAGAKPRAADARRDVPGTAAKSTSVKPSASERATPSASRPKTQPAAATSRPAAATDRGRAAPKTSKPASRPAATPSRAPERASSSAVSGTSRGGADRAASQRGKQSMPKGVPAEAKQRGGKRSK